MRHLGYASDPLLPEVRAANCQFTEAQKERKDAEKRCHERKRKAKEKREKANRERAKEGKSPLHSPETMPEPGLSSSGSGKVDFSMLDDADTEGVGSRTPTRGGVNRRFKI